MNKKNVLGKTTFILACIFTLIFMATVSYNIWMLNNMFGGWDILIEMFASVGPVAIISLIFRNLILPIIYSVIFLIYIITLGRGKNIGIGTIALSIFVMTFEIAVAFFSTQIGAFYSLPIFSLINRCVLIYILILPLVNLYCPISKKFFSISAICSMACLTINMIFYYLRNLRALLQTVEYSEGVELFIACLGYLLLPMISLVTVGFLMGYIFFPEKYFKSLE